MKRSFTKEFLTSENNLPYDDSDDIEVVKDEIYDTSRWSSHHELVFKYEGKYYLTDYSRGLTEQQDESPWEYEDKIECTEVRQVEKVVIDWEPVDNLDKVEYTEEVPKAKPKKKRN